MFNRHRVQPQEKNNLGHRSPFWYLGLINCTISNRDHEYYINPWNWHPPIGTPRARALPYLSHLRHDNLASSLRHNKKTLKFYCKIYITEGVPLLSALSESPLATTRHLFFECRGGLLGWLMASNSWRTHQLLASTLIDIRHGWHDVTICDCRLRGAGSTISTELRVEKSYFTFGSFWLESGYLFTIVDHIEKYQILFGWPIWPPKKKKAILPILRRYILLAVPLWPFLLITAINIFWKPMTKDSRSFLFSFTPLALLAISTANWKKSLNLKFSLYSTCHVVGKHCKQNPSLGFVFSTAPQQFLYTAPSVYYMLCISLWAFVKSLTTWDLSLRGCTNRNFRGAFDHVCRYKVVSYK